MERIPNIGLEEDAVSRPRRFAVYSTPSAAQLKR